VNEANGEGTTPLYLAVVQGLTEVVRYLLDSGADPNHEAQGDSEGTSLCAAAAWGYTEIVRALLEHGADANQIENEDEGGGMTALKWARQNKHIEAARVLIEHGASS
jgi:ankyrin repeat protein